MRRTTQKWISLAALVCLWLANPVPVLAGEPVLTTVDTERAVATTPPYVAMLFHRLTGQPPDFDAWAMASDAYGAANSFDKDLVRREKATDALRAYNLITFDDPIIVDVPVRLSSYSRMRQGFLIENFKPDTFYSFSFLGRDYAVVPLDLMDYQWLSFENMPALESLAKKIETDQGQAQMQLWVTPVSADKDNPLQLNEKNYWLLSGRVKKLKIYDKSGKQLIWEGVSREEAAQNRQHVLDLYK